MPFAGEVPIFVFWVYPRVGGKLDCVVLAPSPECAATELGGKLGRQSRDGEWDVEFDKKLFHPPHSPEEARLHDNAWHFQKGPGYPLVLLNVDQGEERVVSLLKRIPLILTPGVRVKVILGRFP